MRTYVLIDTAGDAQTFVDNSGIADWEWGGKASADGFAGYLWANYEGVDPDSYQSELRAYLLSVGEDPKNYL